MNLSRITTLIVTLCLISNVMYIFMPMTAVAETGSRVTVSDLIVTDIQVSADPLFVGDNLTITATIANVGIDNATSVNVTFEAWNDTLSSPIDIGVNDTIGYDNGGQNITNDTEIQVSMHWNTSEAGFEVQMGFIYSINVTATDIYDANTTNDTMRIYVQFIDEEWLVVSQVDPSADTVVRGAPFNITWTVENMGSLDQDPLGDTLYLYLDNGTIGINSTAIQDLDSKESTQGIFDVDTSGLSLGNHTFKLELFNAGQNGTTDNITIIYPNIYIDEINWTPINGTVGDIIQVNATIENNGTANATDVMVHFLVDAPYLVDAHNATVNVSVGEQNTTTFEWNTTGLDAGNHTVKVSLMPVWDSEAFTDNVTLAAGGVADLAVTDMALTPTEAEIGTIINITATIRNVGDWDAVATNVSFKYVKGLNSTQLGMVDIPELQPGQSVDVFTLWDTAGLEPWNYIVWVQADPEGYVVDEEALQNNKADANLILTGKPDLEVTRINMTIGQDEISNISQGDSGTLNIVITNIGTNKSVQTTAEIYLDEGVTPVKTLNLYGLGVDGNYVLQYHWDTTGLAVGNHSFKVVVDAAGNNSEIDELNNVATFEVNVTKAPGTIDLEVVSINVEPTNPSVGDRVIITATVTNKGTGDAINITLLFSYLAPGGGVEIEKMIIPLMAPEEVITEVAEWSTGPLVSGNYNINVSLDPLNEVHDINRTNNHRVTPVTLKPSGGAIGQPHLKIDEIIMTPAKPKKDEKVTVTVKVSNIGDGNATNVRVVLYLDDIEIGTNIISNVVKDGGFETVTFDWKAKEGMHVIKAEVFAGTSSQSDDVLSEVVEVKETGQEMGDYTPILLIVIIILIVAVILLAVGGGGKKDHKKKGFIEEDHDEDDEVDDEEE